MAYTHKEETRIKRENNFKEKLDIMSNSKLILLSEFTNIRTKVDLYNTEFDEPFTIVPQSIINWKRKYPDKFYTTPTNIVSLIVESYKKTFEEAYSEISEYSNGKYKLIKLGTNYTSNDSIIFCNDCEKEYNTRISDLKNNKGGCPNCKVSRQWDNYRFLKEVDIRVGEEYTVLTGYTKMINKVQFRHNVCGKEFGMTANNFIHTGNRCPFCSHIVKISKPCLKIEKYLDDNNIKYDKEVIFPDLFIKSEKIKRNYHLPFDYKIYCNNNYFLLEYDGFQHENGWNKNPISKKNNIYRDSLKNDYCKNNNIPLYRIGYKDEYNVINKLMEILELGSTTIL